MINVHIDENLIELGIADDRFVLDFDRLVEQEPSDAAELKREDERLYDEGRRLRKGFSENCPTTLEGVYVLLRAIEHRNRWAGMSSADRARQSETTDEACAWQLVAALSQLLGQAGFELPREIGQKKLLDLTN